MFNDFRKLPPVVRIVLVLVVIGVVLGIIVLVVGLISSPKAKDDSGNPQPSSSSTPAPTNQNTNGPINGAPAATPTPTFTADPRDNADSTKVYSQTQKDAAYQAASTAYLSYCTHSPNETYSSYVTSVKPFLTTTSTLLGDRETYFDIVSVQVCGVNAGEVNSILKNGDVKVALYPTLATIYQGEEASSLGKKTGTSYETNPTVFAIMRLVNGKWLADSIVES